ncbi:MAG TPA: hypothetical protein VF100_11545 [Thermoanaerobaculia bacterium]
MRPMSHGTNRALVEGRTRGGRGPRRRSAAARTLALAAGLGLLAAAGARAQPDQPPRLDPPEVTLEGRFESAPSRQVYAAIAEQTGLAINVDPHAHDLTVSIDLDGLAPLAALRRVAELAGHFVVPVDARTALVVQDTPQNRKQHEHLGVRTFVLRHAEPQQVMTALRTLIDGRRLVPTDTPARVTIRDTYAKLAVAARIVEILDREPWQIRLRVELLPADAALVGEIAAAGAEVSVERASALRHRAGTPHAAGVISLVGTREAQWKAFHGEDDRLLSLTARGLLDPEDDDLQLDIDLTVLIPGNPRLDTVRQTSSFRLARDRALALPVLLRGARDGTSGEAALLLLAPTVVTRGELDPRAFETFWIGSEATIVEEP